MWKHATLPHRWREKEITKYVTWTVGEKEISPLCRDHHFRVSLYFYPPPYLLTKALAIAVHSFWRFSHMTSIRENPGMRRSFVHLLKDTTVYVYYTASSREKYRGIKRRSSSLINDLRIQNHPTELVISFGVLFWSTSSGFLELNFRIIISAGRPGDVLISWAKPLIISAFPLVYCPSHNTHVQCRSGIKTFSYVTKADRCWRLTSFSMRPALFFRIIKVSSPSGPVSLSVCCAAAYNSPP